MDDRIAPMGITDFEAVHQLWQVTEGVGLNESDSQPNIAAFLERNPGLSFVARQGNEVVGAVLCGHDGRRGYMHHLAVAKAWRRRGIGRKLVEACLSRLRGLGITKCNIFLYADNAPGEQFWQHDGWVHRADLRLMQKPLL